MSKYLLLSLFLIQLPAAPPQHSKWQPVETTTIRWHKSRSPYTLILESAGDIDTRLRIEVPGRRDFTLSTWDGITTLSEGLRDEKLAADNLLKSTYLLLTPKLKDDRGTPLLLVFGWGRGSSPGSLQVLSLDKTGYPIVVCSLTEFELTALTDLDGDDRPEIVGKHCLSQMMGERYSTYDPYSVYSLAGADIKAKRSLALSKEYNLKNYYGWAGPECREDIRVGLVDPQGKPRIMSVEETKRLVSKSTLQQR
jgi:hypothetical protein